MKFFLLSALLLSIPAWAAPENQPLVPWQNIENPCGGAWCKVQGALGSPRALSRFGITLDRRPLNPGGAEGRAWRGQLTVDGRTVHVIVKEPHRLARENLRHEFEIARLLHGDRVQLLEVGGKPYLVMEMFPRSAAEPHLPAHTLADLLQGPHADPRFSNDPAKRDPKLLADVMHAVLTEVERLHMHPEQIIHGDIKPGNILIGFDAQGRPVARLIDFGTAQTRTRQPPRNPFFKVFGTDGYLSRDFMHGRNRGPEYDMAAVRRLLLESLMRDEMDRLHQRDGGGVLREMNGYAWVDPARIYDDGRHIPAEWGLILQSDIARDVKTFREMLEEAKNPDTFPQKYAARWAATVRTTDLFQRDDNVFHLVAAQNLGPKVFSHLPPAEQTAVLDQLKFRQGWLKTEDAGKLTGFGWHRDAGPLLDAFLKHPLVQEKARVHGIEIPR